MLLIFLLVKCQNPCLGSCFHLIDLAFVFLLYLLIFFYAWQNDWRDVFTRNMPCVVCSAAGLAGVCSCCSSSCLCWERVCVQNASLQRRLLELRHNNKPCPPLLKCVRLWHKLFVKATLYFLSTSLKKNTKRLQNEKKNGCVKWSEFMLENKIYFQKVVF